MTSVDVNDLLFLLHLVLPGGNNNNSDINSTNENAEEYDDEWRSTLTSLPKQRQDLVLAISVLHDSLRAWNTATATTTTATTAVVERDSSERIDIILSPTATPTATGTAALIEVEHAATMARSMAQTYLASSVNYITSLYQYWIWGRKQRTIMEHVGFMLAKQLIQQITLEKSISHQLLTLLNDELYHNDDVNSNNSNDSTTHNMQHKLYTWKSCIQQMIKIDTVLWKLVSNEIHDEILDFDKLQATIQKTKKKKKKQEEEEEENTISNITLTTNRSSKCNCSTMTIQITPLQAPPQQQEQQQIIKNEEIGCLSLLHERILSCISIEDVIQVFTSHQNKQHNHHHYGSRCRSSKNGKKMTSILLMGNEGCGKTYTLDTTIEQQILLYNDNHSIDKIKIIRPNYIIDIIGHTIGSMEDNMIALFTYAIQQQKSYGQKCIIILDDIDKLFGLLSKSNEFFDNNDDSNSTNRCKALFVSILDTLQDKCTASSHSLIADDMNDNDDGHLLLICTAGSQLVEVVDRFDRMFSLDRWEKNEEDVRHQQQQQRRQQMILSCLSSDTSLNENDNVSNDIDAMLSRVVDHTIGKRVCELAQICREVLLRDINEEHHKQEKQEQQSIITHSNDAVVVVKRRLQCLDNILQTITPQSISNGTLDGVVDIRVVTPMELQSLLVTNTVNGTVHLPLLGIAAKRAYDELMNVIVIPLCRSDEIHALLYDGEGGKDHNNNNNTTRSTSFMRVGALLAGNPGVGKTTLAYHCAAKASNMSKNNRGVTLLDVSATSLIHKEIGSSERAVQSLFVAVRAAAPCILLIDGIDSVALRRGNDNTTEGTMDRVLSTFLTELDGIEESEYSGGNVAVIGITHHPNMIDPALLRPGRLEKVITLGGLDYEARKEIVLRQIEDCTFDFTSTSSSSSMDDYSFDNNIKNKNDIANFVAYETTNMSAVEVIAICREASMVCLRELNFDIEVKPSLTCNHFQRAITIMKGKK